MQKYWSHAAMLLLGASLVVGFYEGRRLVKNTAKALTAAASVTASPSGRRGRDRDRDRDRIVDEDAAQAEDLDGEVGIAAQDDMGERKRRRRGRNLDGPDDVLRADKPASLIRERQRQRALGVRTTVPLTQVPTAGVTYRPSIPVGLPEKGEGPLEAPVVDTAVEDP